MRSGLELLLAAAMAGVCEREAMVRDEAVRARPRVWLGSREAEEGFSIWCDAFPAAGRACRRGKAAAGARVSSARQEIQCSGGRARAPHCQTPTPHGGAFHGSNYRAADRHGWYGGGGGTHTCRWPRVQHLLAGAE